jgi:hypothetical protein
MKVSKSATFLFELMVVILIFTFAASICTSIFAKSYLMSAASGNITMAVVKAESAAEQYKNDPSVAADRVYYDENWQITKDPDKADFSLEIAYSDERIQRDRINVDTSIDAAEIVVTDLHPSGDESGILYTLKTVKYRSPGERGSATAKE